MLISLLTEEISIAPVESTWKLSLPALADVTRHPSGTRMRSRHRLGGSLAGGAIFATTCPWLSFELIVNETSPKQVGARTTLITLPSSSQRFGVAKHSRKVSGGPSSSMSQS